MGGEKIKAAARVGRCAGSPPRGRGKVRFVLLLAVLVGITPAWAGKSMTAPGRSSRTGDHTRVGGEKNNHIIDNQYGKGSPPRRRGKGGKSFTGNMFTGITPAWAGKRTTTSLITSMAKDHPRVGGEKAENLLPEICLPGSPPRGRGKASVWHYR